MGYFSNGDEGLSYQADYCDHCLHNDINEGCPVWQAHILWNYDECNKPDSILHKMIPRDGVENGECFAFCEKRPGVARVPLTSRREVERSDG